MPITITDVASLKKALNEERNKLVALMDERERLSLEALSGNSSAMTELARIKKEIGLCESTIETNKEAIKASACRESSASMASYDFALMELSSTLQAIESEFELKLQQVVSEAHPNEADLEKVVQLALAAHQLGVELFAATADEKYKRNWNLKGRLGAHAQTLPYFQPYGRKPVLKARPWSKLIEQIMPTRYRKALR